MSRRIYAVDLRINRKAIKSLVIDPHYEIRHRASISDELILELVQTLSGRSFEPVQVDPPYSYFVEDRILIRGKFYKLIWLLEENEIYIGVVNAYRR